MIYDNETCRVLLRTDVAPFGMLETLRDMGIQTEGGFNGLFASDPVAAQAHIDAWTPAQSLVWAKATTTRAISAHAASLRDRVIAGVSPGEMAAWPIKRAEAIAYAQTGSASDAPMLFAEAQARGISLSDLVAKVNSNTALFAGIEVVISGMDGKHRDAIATLATAEDVMSYDWRTGWPEV